MLVAHLASTRDAGAERDARPPKPCCARMGNGVWCALPDGHQGEHLGYPRTPSKEPA